jgi:hypothetical protein
MMLDLQTYSFPHFPGLLDQCPTTGDWGIELGRQRLVLMKDVQCGGRGKGGEDGRRLGDWGIGLAEERGGSVSRYSVSVPIGGFSAG